FMAQPNRGARSIWLTHSRATIGGLIVPLIGTSRCERSTFPAGASIEKASRLKAFGHGLVAVSFQETTDSSARMLVRSTEKGPLSREAALPSPCHSGREYLCWHWSVNSPGGDGGDSSSTRWQVRG